MAVILNRPYVMMPEIPANVWYGGLRAMDTQITADGYVRWINAEDHECTLRLVFPEMALVEGTGQVHENPDPGSDPPPPDYSFGLRATEWNLIKEADLDVASNTLIAPNGDLYRIAFVSRKTAPGDGNFQDLARVIKVNP